MADDTMLAQSLMGDPTLYAQQAQLERRQQLANALLQQSMTPDDYNRTYAGGMVAPGAGLASGIRQLGQALLSRNLQGKVSQDYGNLMATRAAMIDRALNSAVNGGTASPGTSGSDASSPSGAPAPVTGGGDQSMTRLLALARLKALGVPVPDALLTAVAPTDLAKNAGSTNPLVRAAVEKQGTIDLRPGGIAFTPDGPVAAPENGVQKVFKPGQGWVESAVPGAAEARAGIKGAEESAKQEAEIVPVTTGSGAVQYMTKKQAAGGKTGGGGAAKKPVATPASVAPISEDAWSTIPKRYEGGGVGQSTFDKAMAEKQADTANTLGEKFGTQADAANQRIALNNQALSLVDKADTGPMAARVGGLKNWLVSNFHIDESHFKDTPTATIALQKDLLNAATQRAKAQFGSRMTQSEVMLMLSHGAPNVDMTKAAIKYLLASDNASLQYQIKQAGDFGEYLQRGGDPMRFESWYAQKFPADKALGAVHMDAGSKPAAKPAISQQEALAEARRRGLIK